jgi:hypothetical protein
MAITTLKVLASLLQLHGPGATVQSDHQGIDALLSDLRGQVPIRCNRGCLQTRRICQRGARRRLSQGRICSGVGAFRRGDLFEDTRSVERR